jgi:hypothetical protein
VLCTLLTSSDTKPSVQVEALEDKSALRRRVAMAPDLLPQALENARAAVAAACLCPAECIPQLQVQLARSRLAEVQADISQGSCPLGLLLLHTNAQEPQHVPLVRSLKNSACSASATRTRQCACLVAAMRR